MIINWILLKGYPSLRYFNIVATVKAVSKELMNLENIPNKQHREVIPEGFCH